MKKNWGFLVVFLVLAVSMLEFVPAPTECYGDPDCPPGYYCDLFQGEGFCTPDGKLEGASCTSDAECISLNCVYDISCDKSLGPCLQFCAATTDECGRNLAEGYDTGETYLSWICLGDDLGGKECTTSNMCSISNSKYCDGNLWVLSEPSQCGCGSVSTTNVFKVNNNLGEELFRVDTDGDVAFQGGLFHDSDINEVTHPQFQIKRAGSNSEFRVIGSNKIAVYEGTKYESQSSIALTSGGDFVVKNSAGTIVFMITDQGNIYSKGKISSGCGCDAGSYSNPKDLDGNYIAHYGDWGDDYRYAAGYCAQVHGCQNYKDVSITADGNMACRCDYTNAFGCSGTSCDIAAGGLSDWYRITGVTCY